MRKLTSPILWILAALPLAACAVGSPPGFSGGDAWGFPLVGPLEDGLLVVPAKVNGKGPYLFLVDPDAARSSIDAALANSFDLYMEAGPQELDESDTLKNTVLAEVESIQIADLTVSNMKVHVHKMNKFWAGGRMLRGVIGRDIVSEGMTLAVDRERGMLYLATQQGQVEAPPGAVMVKGRRYNGRLLVNATLNRAKQVSVSVDVGAPATMLWQKIIEGAHLPVRAVAATLVDELGTEREVKAGGLAAKLAVGEVEGDAVLVLPYGDKRFREVDLDGALGQTFLADFHLTINFHKSTVAFKRRPTDPGELAGERMRRWGDRFDKCATAACVTVTLDPPVVPAVAPEAPAAPVAVALVAPVPPADVPRHIVITREDFAVEFDYEVMVEAVDAQGQPLGLPRLRATLPSGVKTVLDPAGAVYATAAGFRVLDLSPFPRPCDQVGTGARCMWAVVEAH